MDLLKQLNELLGSEHVLTGADATRYGRDWTGAYTSQPRAVLRPANTQEVSAIVKAAAASGTPIVPVSGNTGLSGGTHAEGALMVSVERMNRIHEINTGARIAIVDAGVVLSRLHEAAADVDLCFPLTFGARGSAMIGGALSTNAGGSNVLRYGSTRGLCLGLEAVLPNGEILDLMGQLHKDNSGYALKDLLIGAEGTLGLITKAVLRLSPAPKAYATALIAVPQLDTALDLLHRLQEATGNAVEAFEYMPAEFHAAHDAMHPERPLPLQGSPAITILMEVGATAPRDATPDADGAIPVVDYLESVLAEMMEKGLVSDATIARSEAQRQALWATREAAAEVAMGNGPVVLSDVSVPLDKVATFLERIEARVAEAFPASKRLWVSHLGDGNVHYNVLDQDLTPHSKDQITEMIEDEVRRLNGSFSAEHGIGLSKKNSMARRKDRVALSTMRAIKTALDPQNLMNPGKILPD